MVEGFLVVPKSWAGICSVALGRNNAPRPSGDANAKGLARGKASVAGNEVPFEAVIFSDRLSQKHFERISFD